jgi:hypothetical protein
MGKPNLSGKDRWRANQANYPNSQDIDELESGFRLKTDDFVGSLRHARATLVVNSTRRNPIRADLMHYSWKVAYGELDPKDLPKRGGLAFEWDHGDLEKSRKGEEEMVKLFGMVHIAALSSGGRRGSVARTELGGGEAGSSDRVGRKSQGTSVSRNYRLGRSNCRVGHRFAGPGPRECSHAPGGTSRTHEYDAAVHARPDAGLMRPKSILQRRDRHVPH